MDRFGWAVHRVDEVFQSLLTQQTDFGLLHCRGTSTGWKAKRFDLPKNLVRDDALVAFMAAHFALPEGSPQPSAASEGKVSSNQ